MANAGHIAPENVCPLRLLVRQRVQIEKCIFYQCQVPVNLLQKQTKKKLPVNHEFQPLHGMAMSYLADLIQSQEEAHLEYLCIEIFFPLILFYSPYYKDSI